MSDTPEPANDTADTAKPRGRPASDKPTLTAAERQRAYRQRLKDQPVEAQGQIRPLGRVALVRALSANFAALEDAGRVGDHELARWDIARIMRELATRYGIKPE